jgi:chromosome segregation ATPase
VDVTDEDMQMVRTWLEEAKAPEYIKGHFENLVSEHAKEAGRVEELEEELGECSDYDDLKRDVARLQEEVDEIDSDQIGALETVKYWLSDVLVHGRPMQKSPREILRIVEEAL